MTWNRERFSEFQRRVKDCVQGRRPASGTTFFLYVYDPTEERRCIENMKQFASTLQRDGHTVHLVWTGQLMARILAKRGYAPEVLRDIEGKSRERLLDPSSGLSRPKGGLADDVTKALLKGMYQTPSLSGGSQDEVAFLLRTGALYPFIHISQIMSKLENETDRTLCIAFPGSLDPRKDGVLRFLNEGTGRYYRATIVVG